MSKNPLEGIQHVHDVAEVVREYEVVLGQMTLGVKVLRYLHEGPIKGRYYAVSSHVLVLGDSEYRGPGDGPFETEEMALWELISEFSDRIQSDWGSEHWKPESEL